MEVDRNGLEVLERDECLRLLATATIGRLATTFDALPVVLPVNFRLVGDHVVFRTGLGTKLEAATREAVVAFEADHFEPFGHAGWSVLITGVAHEVTLPHELEAVAAANIPRWAPSEGARAVRVSTDLVSGRRIVPGLNARERGT